MDLKLNKKKALVTGSTAGIGFAIARLLAHEGATVYINGRTEQRVQEAIAQIQKERPSGEMFPAPGDIGTKEGAEIVLKKVPSVDILINNMGIYEIKPFEEITDEDWRRFFEINVLSGIRLSRHYFPLMKKSNWGRIVFISSESAVHVPKEMIHYGMTKTAQLAVARGLAEMTAGTEVTVNSILVGPTSSEGVEGYIRETANAKGMTPQDVQKEFFESVRPGSLLNRFETSDEVAAVVAFVCSQQAIAINGAALRVEGGLLRSIL